MLRARAVAADECHATGLAAAAHEELAIAGARPRRDPLRTPEALTAAELRTARLAAEGKTNREMAQMHFVTAKIVEAHLRSTHAKLGSIRAAPRPGAPGSSSTHGASAK